MIQQINSGANFQINNNVFKSKDTVSLPDIQEKENTNANVKQSENIVFKSSVPNHHRIFNKKGIILSFAAFVLGLSDLFTEKTVKGLAPSTRENERNKKIENELSHLARPIQERTQYNTKQLKAAGVRDADIKKYLTIDGHVNDSGKKILREKGKSYK